MVIGLVDRVTKRLRKGRRVARTVVLRLRFDDFTRATRSHTFEVPTARTETILQTARALLAATVPIIEHRGLTLVGVAVANLERDDATQLALPLDRSSGMELDVAIDEVRRRFGSSAVTRGVLMGGDPHATVPLLPD